MSLNNKILNRLLPMNYKDEITKIFCEVDDFCKEFSSQIALLKRGQLSGTVKHRNRSGRMADSEIITILVGYHLGAHKTFKHYYNQIVTMHSDLFPRLVSYNRFVELQQRVFVVDWPSAAKAQWVGSTASSCIWCATSEVNCYRFT